eukprot:GILJ01002079.1.p1 GENE.GILJ01002079.1~~GILJ01002079.1.p1  ORF type:complete len:683 (-),score=124.47 GILJ01002079.1:144-2192(-)
MNDSSKYLTVAVAVKTDDRARRLSRMDSFDDRLDITLFSTWRRCRIHVRRFLDSRPVEIFLLLMVLVYAIKVFIDLATSDSPLDADVQAALDTLDFAILCFFLAELVLRLGAFGKAYLTDWWNIFDGAIVIASFVLGLITVSASSLVVLRIMRVIFRLLRVVVIFRKVSESNRTLHRIRKVTDYAIRSPVERVIEILNYAQSLKGMNHSVKDDLNWCIEVIASNKLHDPVIDASFKNRRNGRAFLEDLELEAWVDQVSGRVTKRSVNGRRGSTTISRISVRKSFNGNSSSHEDLMDQFSTEPIESVFDKVDSISFDIFEFRDVCGGDELVIMGFKLFEKFRLFSKFSINSSRLVNFLREIQSGYRETNPYHNATHAADVAQTSAFILTTGKLAEKAKMSDLEIMGMLFAAIIHDFEHPGFNNPFHIKTKHPLAIRYNDKSVLESHHVAAAFAVLLKEECNFMHHMADDRYRSIRENIVALVMATDMANHFQELGIFRGKLNLPDFANLEKKDDRQLVFDIALHASDISNPAKPLPIYAQWVHRVMNEFFLQGDQEKRLNLPVSMFMDRDTASINKCQVGFMDVIVQPLFVAFHSFLPDIDPFINNIASNKMHFQALLEQENLRANSNSTSATVEPKTPALPTVTVPVISSRPQEGDSPASNSTSNSAQEIELRQRTASPLPV